MTISLKHATVATAADDPAAEINKAQWNAEHAITGDAGGVPYFDGAGALTADASKLSFDPEVYTGLRLATDMYVARIADGDYVQLAAQNDSEESGSTSYLYAGTAGSAVAYLLSTFDGSSYFGARSPSGQSWVSGVDGSDSDKFVLSKGSALGTNNVFTADGTTFEVVDVLKINNTVAVEAQGAGTHVVSINIGGTSYKLLAVLA